MVIKQLAGNTFNVLDTVKTDSKGSYSYTMEVKEGQPEFVYVFDGDTKLASLLLGKGDKVKVVSDAKGGYTVEGSDDCSRLKQVEDEFSSFLFHTFFWDLLIWMNCKLLLFILFPYYSFFG